MHASDRAIPTLPSRSIPATVAFYERLGFDADLPSGGGAYAVLTRGPVELHFFGHAGLVPAESSAGCYIRVQDVDELYGAFAPAQLPAAGMPRMDPVGNRPWGMREFAVVDPDGNQLRIGQPL